MKHLLFVFAIIITAVGCGTESTEQGYQVKIQLDAEDAQLSSAYNGVQVNAFEDAPATQYVGVSTNGSVFVTVIYPNGFEVQPSVTAFRKELKPASVEFERTMGDGYTTKRWKYYPPVFDNY